MQDHNDNGHHASRFDEGRDIPAGTTLSHGLTNNDFDNHWSEADNISLIVGLGIYNLYFSLDTSCFQSSEVFFGPLTRRFQSFRRWRCEGLFLFAWLMHVCLIWTLRALEASEAQAICTKTLG